MKQRLLDNWEICSAMVGFTITVGGILFAFLRKRSKKKRVKLLRTRIESAPGMPELDVIRADLNRDLMDEKLDEREFLVLERDLNQRRENMSRAQGPYTQAIQYQHAGMIDPAGQDYQSYGQFQPISSENSRSQGQGYPTAPPVPHPPQWIPSVSEQNQAPGFSQPRGHPSPQGPHPEFQGGTNSSPVQGNPPPAVARVPVFPPPPPGR